ncbi:MAG: peptidyl-tRNA hydrolase Pth2 [Nanoarchaeota archaeon]|nr:peptidyl-tRNA hydrolase Pth2 [Nanoarchaeota archaeon]
MADMKQVIIVRQDLKLQKGKMAAQCAHAAVEAALKSDKDKLKEWRNTGQKKIVLKVEDEKELYRYAQAAKDDDLATAIITDAGKTHMAPGTTTCAGIGPDEEDKIDAVTGELKIM